MTGNEALALFQSMMALNDSGQIWMLRRTRDRKIVALRYTRIGFLGILDPNVAGSWCWERKRDPKEPFWLDDADKWWKDKTGRRGHSSRISFIPGSDLLSRSRANDLLKRLP